jgi:hypothetical protein
MDPTLLLAIRRHRDICYSLTSCDGGFTLAAILVILKTTDVLSVSSKHNVYNGAPYEGQHNAAVVSGPRTM